MDVFGLALSAGGEFLRAAALAAVHDLGVVDALAAAGPAGRTLDELADALGLGGGRRRLRPLLDVLVAMAVLVREGLGADERYALTSPPPPRPAVVRAGWGRLAEVIRDDRPLPQDDSAEGLGRYHDHLLAAGAEAAAETAAWLGDSSLVDLGGGAGVYTAAFLRLHPAANATLVDDGAVLALARAHLDGRGVGARVTLVAGDARTVALDPGFGAALLANLLHLHPPTVCAELVLVAARAVGPGGVIAIKDLRLDDDRRGSVEGLWFALNMALYTDGGDVHTTAALRGWLVDAGLVDVEVIALASAPDAIVVRGRRPSVEVVEAGRDDAVAPLRPLVPAPAEPEARQARARADGFLYLRRLLPLTRLAPLRALVDAALIRRGWLVDGASDPALRLGRWDDPRWVELLAEILPSAPFRALAAAPELLAAVRAVLGDEPVLHVGDVCRVVSPGAADLATPAHQDAAYLGAPDGVWTAWLPLGPCPRALGPLTLLPGSHQGGLRPHAAVVAGGTAVGTAVPADAAWHGADLAAGDVLLFSSFTVHRALPNRTADRLRVSVDYRYRPRGARAS